MRTTLHTDNPIHDETAIAASLRVKPVIWAQAQVLDVRPSVPLVARPGPAPGRRRRRRVRWDIVVRVLGGLLAAAVLALAVWAVVTLVMAVVAFVAACVAAVSAAVAWVHAHLAALIFVAVLLLLCLFSGGSKCRGLHCGGCRR